MELFADRYAIDDEGRAVDVATGLRILVRKSRADAATDVAWNARCDAFHRLRHAAIAPLIDYGPVGRGERFEAWQCGPAWSGPQPVADASLAVGGRFLRCAGLSSATTPAVHVRDGSAVLVPGMDAVEESDAEDAASLPIGARGLVLVERPVIAALAEMFRDVAGPRGHVAALWGRPGSGRKTIAGELARLARLNGFVPVSSRLIGSAYGQLWRGRSLFVVHDGAGDVWPAALDASIRSPVPHVVLIVSNAEVPAVDGVGLARVPPEALVEAVRPRRMTAAIERQVRRAAERSHGWPGRFVRQFNIATARNATVDRLRVCARVAEPAVVYGGSEHTDEEATTRPAATWPAPGELAAFRERIADAVRNLERGRHERAVRDLRHAIGGLARRGSWTEAAEAGVVLSAALRRRGQVHAALSAAAEARDHASRSGTSALVLDVAIETGETYVDAVRVDEAETVLAAAVTSAVSLDDRDRRARAALALARCLFWRGRHDEALAAAEKANGVAGETIDLRRRRLLALCAAARGDAPSALGIVAELSDRISAIGTATALHVRAAVDYCAAAVHLAAGDAPAAASRAVAAISTSRLAHDPLRAIRSRLVLSEAERRRGRPALAAAQLRRVGRIAGSLPPLVQAEVRLVRLLADDSTSGAEAAARHIQQCALPALRLLVPPAAGTALSGHQVVDEVIAIVRACQTAEEELVVLKDVCARVRQQLHASAVAFAAGGDRTAVLAADGARIDLDVAQRAMAAGVCIQPHRREDHIVAAAPVQYGGATVGALAVRWTFGSTYDQSHAAAVLATTAVASAPIVWAAIARRDRIVTSPAKALLGATPAVDHVRRLIDRAAAAPFPVLIDGESGCGKELVAQAVHRGSPRRDRPFRTLNCAAIPDDLVEAELFGHVRGAFTGALADRTGVFEEAHGGTLLLDEVGELTPRAQAKLLRVIQEGEVRRVGENLSRRVDVRIVAATNRDLHAETEAGRFRLDLLYRLDVIRISVPPLRERADDVPLLVEHYWREATERVNSRATLAAATVGALARYRWPGNVRELQNVLAALAVRCPKRGVVPPSALPTQFASPERSAVWRLEEARRVFEEGFVRAALVRTGGHRARAAAELGVTRQGLTKLMTRLGIDDGRA